MKTLPNFTSTRAIVAWGEAQEALLAPDDLAGRAALKALCLGEIRQLYAQWEQDLRRPVSEEERTQIQEELQELSARWNTGLSDLPIKVGPSN